MHYNIRKSYVVADAAGVPGGGPRSVAEGLGAGRRAAEAGGARLPAAKRRAACGPVPGACTGSGSVKRKGRRSMNRNQLRYFVAAAETRSFTKAADQFFISQTAITQQIKLLEEMLGCPLFDRGTRPVTLTPAGQAFLAEAKAILERMDHAIDRAHGAATGLAGTLRVGYLKGYEQSEFTDFLRQFHQRHTNLLTTFYRCTTDQLAAGLLNDQFDLILTWDSTNLRQEERVDWLPVEEVRLVAALYAGHPLAQRLRLTRRELRGEPIIYMSPAETLDSYGDAFFMNLYKEAGYRPNILFCSSDIESILMMVAAEEGVSILPDYSARKYSPAENLVFIPLTGAEEKEEVIAVWRQDTANPALAQFVEALRAAVPFGR